MHQYSPTFSIVLSIGAVPRLTRGVVASLVLTGAALLPAALAAQDRATGFVGVGVGTAPDYVGSDDYVVIPQLTARIARRGIQYEFEGLGGRIDVSRREGFGYGPAARFRFGRDSDVDDPVVSLLDPVDESFEIGAFVRFGQPVGLATADQAVVRLDVLADVADGHSGVVADLSAAYTFRPAPPLGITIGASAGFGSDSFTDAYFSVSPVEALRTGLPAYRADGGLTSIGLNLVATYQFTQTWGAIGFVSASRLMGDAADSPIVEQRGSRAQYVGGLGLSYSF